MAKTFPVPAVQEFAAAYFVLTRAALNRRGRRRENSPAIAEKNAASRGLQRENGGKCLYPPHQAYGRGPRKVESYYVTDAHVRFGRSNLKRGLVLEGGGTKGAYAFGLLERLHEEGVTFDCVSGTSVGALNALLWCSSEMALGRTLWQTLTRRRIFTFRSGSALFPLAFSAHLYFRFLKGLPPFHGHPNSRTNRILRFFFTLFNYWSIPSLLLYDHETSRSPIMWLAFAIMALFIAHATLRKKTDLLDSTLENTFRLWPVTLFPVLVFGFVVWGVIPFRVFLTTLLYGALALLLVLALLRVCLLGTSPLRELVGTLAERPLIIPIYVTVAHEEWGFDPDDPSYELIDAGRPLHHAVPKRFDVPSYVKLNSLNFRWLVPLQTNRCCDEGTGHEHVL